MGDGNSGSTTPAEFEAFAGLTHIEQGDWDRFLVRLQAAIRRRMDTEEYEDHIIAGRRHG